MDRRNHMKGIFQVVAAIVGIALLLDGYATYRHQSIHVESGGSSLDAFVSSAPAPRIKSLANPTA